MFREKKTGGGRPPDLYLKSEGEAPYGGVGPILFRKSKGVGGGPKFVPGIFHYPLLPSQVINYEHSLHFVRLTERISEEKQLQKNCNSVNFTEAVDQYITHVIYISVSISLCRRQGSA